MTHPLLLQVEEAWLNHLRERVSRGLPAELHSQTWNEESWNVLDNLTQDPGWKYECLKRDPKFDMHVSIAVSLLPDPRYFNFSNEVTETHLYGVKEGTAAIEHWCEWTRRGAPTCRGLERRTDALSRCPGQVFELNFYVPDDSSKNMFTVQVHSN